MVLPTACVLYGASDYANNWIGINILVILISMMAVAFVFTISRLLPTATRSKLTDITRNEFSQIFISIIIVVVMMGLTQTACNVSASLSQQITGTQQSPFQYADYYIGNLATNTGISLLTNLYSVSVEYQVYASIITQAGNYLSSYVNILQALPLTQGSVVSSSLSPSLDFGSSYAILADLYIDIFSPIVILTIGMLFVQYLALPILQYSAFAVILPVALALRSISFAGGGLRSASNAILAIAIAAYIIYPLTVAFDSYMVSWLFSSANPSYQYLGCTFGQQCGYVLGNITPNAFFSGQIAPTNIFGLVLSSLSTPPDPLSVVNQARSFVNQIAQFLFVGVVLFALNVAITVGFARGLSKALDSGLEVAASFWGSL